MMFGFLFVFVFSSSSSDEDEEEEDSLKKKMKNKNVFSEKVQRDHHLLSVEDKLAIVVKDSPELLGLLR